MDNNLNNQPGNPQQPIQPVSSQQPVQPVQQPMQQSIAEQASETLEPANPTPVMAPTQPVQQPFQGMQTPVTQIQDPLMQQPLQGGFDNQMNMQMGQEVMPPPLEKPKSKKPLLLVIILLVIACIAGFLVWFFVIRDNKKDDSKDNTKTEEKETKKEETKKEETKDSDSMSDWAASKYNGVYKNDKVVIKLFAYSKKKIYYVAKGDGFYVNSGDLDFSNDVAEYDHFDDKYKFTLDSDGVNVESNNEDIPAGKYTKESDYSINDFYTDSYGDPELLKSKYSGCFKKGNDTLYLVQTSDKDVRVAVFKETYTFDVGFEIKEEGYLFEDFMGEVYNITLNNDKAEIKLVSSKKEVDEDTKIDGEYTKVSDLTMEEVMKNLYPRL